MAKIVIDFKGDLIEIDSRPIDALALAVRTNAPIYAEDKVLDKAGLELDKNDEELSSTETYADTKDKKSSEQKELKLSAFDEFMEELDLDDY